MTTVVLPEYKDIYNQIFDEYEGPIIDSMPNLPVYAWYFNEREKILRRREESKSRPWTHDPILDCFRFTNVFRDDDKVSMQLNHVCGGIFDQRLRMFNAIAFRMFNCLEGYRLVSPKGYVKRWDEKAVMARFDNARANNKQIFGGAYLIANSLASGFPKHQFYVRLLTKIWKDKAWLLRVVTENGTLQHASEILQEYPGIGGFLGYEFALDLEANDILIAPDDKYTWANIGPGARRGINFIEGVDRNTRRNQKDCLLWLRDMYDIASEFIDLRVIYLYDIDMRLLENGLCETSKYASVLTTGRAKRKYHG